MGLNETTLKNETASLASFHGMVEEKDAPKGGTVESIYDRMPCYNVDVVG